MFRSRIDDLAHDLIHNVFRGRGVTVPGGRVKRSPASGDVGDCALLCSSPAELAANGRPRLPSASAPGTGHDQPTYRTLQPPWRRAHDGADCGAVGRAPPRVSRSWWRDRAHNKRYSARCRSHVPAMACRCHRLCWSAEHISCVDLLALSAGPTEIRTGEVSFGLGSSPSWKLSTGSFTTSQNCTMTPNDRFTWRCSPPALGVRAGREI